MIPRSRRPRRRTAQSGHGRRRTVPTPTDKSTVGGHLLKANRDRGLGKRGRLVVRYKAFQHYPRTDARARNDRPNIDTGTAGNGAALAAQGR